MCNKLNKTLSVKNGWMEDGWMLSARFCQYFPMQEKLCCFFIKAFKYIFFTKQDKEIDTREV